MKKALTALLIGVFLTVLARPVVAGGSGNDATKVGIVAGTLAVIVGIATLGSYYRTAETEVTNRRAIDAEERAQLEQIRSSTVLASPAALGGNGEAEYSSPEGKAEIRVRGTTQVAAPQPAPAPAQSGNPHQAQPSCVSYYYPDPGTTGCGPRAPRYQYPHPQQFSYGYGYNQYPHPRRIFRENNQTTRIPGVIEMTR